MGTCGGLAGSIRLGALWKAFESEPFGQPVLRERLHRYQARMSLTDTDTV